MPNYIRTHTAGATYFFTVTLRDRGARYLVDHVADLRACMADVKKRHPFEIDAMVVLPEHIHALWTLPTEDGDFSRRWMLLKQAFTRRLQAGGVLDRDAAEERRKGQRSLWQDRFWEHQIRDDDDFARHVDYIHFNPVKHGWVMRARDWPYSSLHRYVREKRLPADWGISAAIEEHFGE
ncbi:MAG TPA: transposase [Ramlibacter sp.]|uniref:REP-associated tyrosine transposase n=1 Tax=Ramlibacter sp. TaxID=1917967 RepID=UPI002ED430AA